MAWISRFILIMDPQGRYTEISIMSFFTIVTSFDSKKYFPDNRTSNFRVKLNKPLRFETDQWLVGLSEFYMKSDTIQSEPQLLQVMSNVCTTSYVGEEQKSILRQVPMPATVGDIRIGFHPSFYLKVSHNYLDTLHIYITDEHGKEVSLGNAITSCTLHFEKQ